MDLSYICKPRLNVIVLWTIIGQWWMMIYSVTAQERKNIRTQLWVLFIFLLSVCLSLSDIILKAINNIFEDWKHKHGVEYMYLGTDLCHCEWTNCSFHSHYERKKGKERKERKIKTGHLLGNNLLFYSF